MQHKEHFIEGPVQAVCSLEIGGRTKESLTVDTIKGATDGKVTTRGKTGDVVDAGAKTRLLLEED